MHLVGFAVEIYYDAQTYERQNYTVYFYLASETNVVMVKQDGDVQNKGCVHACMWVGQKISAQGTYLGYLF